MLQTLRNQVRTLDVDEEGAVRTLEEYYAHTKMIAPRFPFGSSTLDVTFVWYDPFRSTRFSDGNLAFEQASILFNLAAVHGRAALDANRTEVEGVKAACAHFAAAAGAFAHIKAHIVSALDTPVSPELTTEALTLGEKLYIAQAAETVFEKAVMDGRGNGILAKVAAAAGEQYEAAYASISSSVLEGQFHVSWKNHLQTRLWVFKAYAHYHEGLAQGEACEYGIELAHLGKAQGYVSSKAMAKLLKGVPADIIDMVNRLKARIAARHEEAERDNNTIYCEVVPAANTLPTIAGKLLVRAKPVPEVSEIGVPDLFSALVPLRIVKQASKYSDQVESLIRRISATADEASDVANSTLASLNLPAAVQSLDAPAGVPPGLASKAATLRSEGGVSGLASSLETRKMLATMNGDILRETLATLDAEETEDSAMRTHYGTRWARAPSRTFTVKIREDIAKFQASMDAAQSADAGVDAKYQESAEYMATLELPASQLGALIPASSDPELAASPVVVSLKKALVSIDRLIRARTELKDRIKAVGEADDVTNMLISEVGTLTSDQIFDRELQKYAQLETEMMENISGQGPIMGEIETLNEQFVSSRSASAEQQERETLLSNLDIAFRHYVQIKANVTDGIAFYTKMQETLLTLQTRASDFVYARDTEKADILRQFQAQATGVTPPNPTAYQQPAGGVYAPGGPPAGPPPGWQQPTGTGLPPPPAFDAPSTSAPSTTSGGGPPPPSYGF